MIPCSMLWWTTSCEPHRLLLSRLASARPGPGPGGTRPQPWGCLPGCQDARMPGCGQAPTGCCHGRRCTIVSKWSKHPRAHQARAAQNNPTQPAVSKWHSMMHLQCRLIPGPLGPDISSCASSGLHQQVYLAALQMGLVQCQSSGAQTLCLVVCHPCGWAGVHNMLDATCNCPEVSRLGRCWSGTLATQHASHRASWHRASWHRASWHRASWQGVLCV